LHVYSLKLIQILTHFKRLRFPVKIEINFKLIPAGIPFHLGYCPVPVNIKRLKWVNQLVYKSFNKKIDQPRTESDWLSSQSTEVDKFVNDEYTGFLVSNQLIYETVKHLNDL
jgi:hypothetical protein